MDTIQSIFGGLLDWAGKTFGLESLGQDAAIIVFFSIMGVAFLVGGTILLLKSLVLKKILDFLVLRHLSARPKKLAKKALSAASVVTGMDDVAECDTGINCEVGGEDRSPGQDHR